MEEGKEEEEVNREGIVKEMKKGKGEGKREGKVKKRRSGRERRKERGRERKRRNGKGKEKRKGKEKGKWKKDSFRKVGRTHARTDTQVILYSVQCYALHWTDNNITSQSCASITGWPDDISAPVRHNFLVLCLIHFD